MSFQEFHRIVVRVKDLEQGIASYHPKWGHGVPVQLTDRSVG